MSGPGRVTELRIADTAAMEALGRRLAARLRPGDLVRLDGELGAGKTTLARGIGEGLGVRGAVTSPTFVLARTHPTASGTPLVHVDAYRLGGAAELDDLDLDWAGSIVVVEWGAGRTDGVAESWLEVAIERRLGAEAREGAEESDDTDSSEDTEPLEDTEEPRLVTITGHGPRWTPLPELATPDALAQRG